MHRFDFSVIFLQKQVEFLWVFSIHLWELLLSLEAIKCAQQRLFGTSHKVCLYSVYPRGLTNVYLKSQLAKSILYNCLFTSICLLAALFPAGFVGGISMFAYVLPPPPLYINMDGVSPLLATCTKLKPKYPQEACCHLALVTPFAAVVIGLELLYWGLIHILIFHLLFF